MKTIGEQLDWEHNMATRGVERFRKQQAEATESRGHETSAGSRLLKSYVITISDRIALYLEGKHPEGRRRNKFSKLLDTIDTDKVAMIALRNVIASVFKNGTGIASISIQIGRQCEDELRLSKFQTEYKEYYDSLIRDMQRKNIANYRHKRTVLTAKGKDRGLLWESWSEQDAFGVGALVISLLMEVCDLVERNDAPASKGYMKGQSMLVPTQACLDWISNHDEVVELTSPDRMPCIIPPANWISVTDGGFWSPNLRKRTPLIKSKLMSKEREIMYAEADMPGVLAAVNKMQDTAWRVNTRVKGVLDEVWAKNLGCGMPRSEPYVFPPCPLEEHQIASELPYDSPELAMFNEWKVVTRELHTQEKERVAKNLALIRTMRLAREMEKHDSFWYVYQCDFRGRVYAASAGLTPQGTDHSKALIEFSTGDALTDENGLRWFMINGANKYGNDKVSYEDRLTWVQDNKDFIIECANDPISNRGFWANSDKPFQFLAWVFECADMFKLSNPYEFVSHLPVALDGSCNGLQHFSAMLSDEVGGKSVNLSPNTLPADIYQDVANVCYAKLLDRAKLGEAPAINWLKALGPGGMSRKLPKKPVMTLPYGSTQQACTTSIYNYVTDNLSDKFDKNTFFKHSIYLNPLLWASINEVVIAARAAMDWIQECSVILARKNIPLKYYSPLGFPVLQATQKYKSKQIRTQINGNLQVRVATYTDQLDTRKQRQGSSPNLVHHVDACHMMMVVNACSSNGVSNFAMIHDDFGVPAKYAADLQKNIRQQFVALHNYNDVLQDFKEQHENVYDVKLPSLPSRGSLDITEVLNSDYFFN
jgi:DNA-directed RNA polymerase